ncbi:MAG: hypothetical protein ACI9FB_000165 [Candidatus Azotimanducaceae bacterium]
MSSFVTTRIAMWSGPRNISTAMMRSWENRMDTVVVDEPFYAYYLNESGIKHPMVEEVIRSQSTCWKDIVDLLTKQVIEENIYYQKHMTHHILDNSDMSWTKDVTNCFLIRDPLYVVNSYAKKRDNITIEDIGVKRQFELFEEISGISGQKIPLIDSRAMLLDPKNTLLNLCSIFEIPFLESMMSWPVGKRDSDGIWGEHWYQAVEASSGWQEFEEQDIKLSRKHQRVADESMAYYRALSELTT